MGLARWLNTGSVTILIWESCLQALKVLKTLYSSGILQPSDLNAEARSDLSSLPAELQLQVRCQQGPAAVLEASHSQTVGLCASPAIAIRLLTSQASLTLGDLGPAVPCAAGAVPAVVSSVNDRSSFGAVGCQQERTSKCAACCPSAMHRRVQTPWAVGKIAGLVLPAVSGQCIWGLHSSSICLCFTSHALQHTELTGRRGGCRCCLPSTTRGRTDVSAAMPLAPLQQADLTDKPGGCRCCASSLTEGPRTPAMSSAKLPAGTDGVNSRSKTTCSWRTSAGAGSIR